MTDSEAAGAPAGTGGTGGDVLEVHDRRTGASCEIAIEDGAIRAADLRRIRFGDGPGLSVYDPAFKNTAACRSRITFIDGDRGILRYRGYPIEELAERSTFLDVAWLLLHGELPDAGEREAWRSGIAARMEVRDPLPRMLDGFGPDAHPMGMFIALLAGLGAAFPESRRVLDADNRVIQITRLVAAAPVLGGMVFRRSRGLPPRPPTPGLSYPASLLDMAFGRPPDPVLERAMDVLLILHADHEQNCSTSAMRGVGSAHADPYSACAAASAALYGPLHGGANEAVLRMLDEIGSLDRVPGFLAEVRSGSRRLMGFGHRVYKSYDPRARIIKKTAYEVFEATGRNPRIDIALELERIALEEDYFRSRRLYPNVDFYSGIIYEALGFPSNFFTVLFAIPRIVGWLAQWREMLQDPEQKIARPLQLYVGEPRRPFPAAKASPGAFAAAAPAGAS